MPQTFFTLRRGTEASSGSGALPAEGGSTKGPRQVTHFAKVTEAPNEAGGSLVALMQSVSDSCDNLLGEARWSKEVRMLPWSRDECIGG